MSYYLFSYNKYYINNFIRYIFYIIFNIYIIFLFSTSNNTWIYYMFTVLTCVINYQILHNLKLFFLVSVYKWLSIITHHLLSLLAIEIALSGFSNFYLLVLGIQLWVVINFIDIFTCMIPYSSFEAIYSSLNCIQTPLVEILWLKTYFTWTRIYFSSI